MGLQAELTFKNMNSLIKFRTRFHHLALLLSFLPSITVLAENTEHDAPFDLNSVFVEGGDLGPAQTEIISLEEQGNSAEALKILMEHGKNFISIFFPTPDVLVQDFNTLTFKIKFDPDGEATRSFEILVSSRNGGWSATAFSRHAHEMEDGWHEFSWDIINEPETYRNTDFSDVNRIAIKFRYPAIPEGVVEEVIIKDMKLVSGRSVETGDAVLFNKWKDYAKSYQPDYNSDFNAFLPPEKGRLDTPLTLTSKGKAIGEIIINADASEPEKVAAKELQFWIEKITSVHIPITHEASMKSDVKIFLGKAFAEAAYQTDLTALGGSDGFAVRNDGNHIYIFGAIPKGTLNGVFAFLENNTDIIWARPHIDYGTVYSQNPEFKILWGDTLDIPATKFRGWMPNAGDSENWFGNWAHRNRNNYVTGPPQLRMEWGDRTEFGGGHNLQFFIPKGDPLYYPTIDGEKPETLSIWKHQICLSVPGLVETFAGNVLTYIQEKGPPGLNVFNIKIEDNWGVCECEKCLAPLVLSDGTQVENNDPAFRSTQFYQFLNSVTEKINKTIPDLKIQTYAYFYTSVPPKIPLNENIYILFCPYVRKDHRTPLYSPVNDHWWKLQKQWAEVTPNIIVREYYGILNGGRPLAEVVAEDVRTKLNLNIRSFSSEISVDDRRFWWDGNILGDGDMYDLNMMEYWVINRLYWDPEVDVEELRRYFIARTFREAAPEMNRFFGMIREKWFSRNTASTWGEGALHQEIVGEGRQDEAIQLLAQALEKATHPVARILIARIDDRIHNAVLPSKPETPITKVVIDNENAVPPAILFNYGWSRPAFRTTVEENGEFKNALRIRYTGNLTRSVTQNTRTDMSGHRIRYNLVRTSDSEEIDEAVLPRFQLGYQGDAIEESSDSNYTKNADGSYTFDWYPTGEVNGRAQDLSRVVKGLLTYPESELGKDQFAEFVITDFEIVKDKTTSTRVSGLR